MDKKLKKVPAVFYQTSSGTQPVRDWLKDLPQADRQIIGFDIASVEYGWPIGMPLCRPLGKGLWEVKCNLTNTRIARIIFCMSEGHMVLLHGFIKKTQKTPPADLALARTRQLEVDK